MSTATTVIKAASITISLLTSGAIGSYSYFAVPLLQSQPASRSLPSVRWLFSRGSHVLPEAVFTAAAGFVYLAIISRAPGRAAIQVLNLLQNGSKTNGYLAAAALSALVFPTTKFMVPTNFELIRLNEVKGGARSAKVAEARKETGAARLSSAEDSADGKDQLSQFTDRSGPQTRTEDETTEEEDQNVRELLDAFSKLNYVRAFVTAAGGVVALLAALA